MTEELERKAYRDLIRYVRWLGRVYGVRGHWMLNPDDLMGEALFTLAKCINKYIKTKSYNEFLALARVSMLNTTKTLIYKATLTHRNAEMYMVGLDDPLHSSEDGDFTVGDQIPGGVEPETYFDSMQRVEALMSKLGSDAIQVLNAILGGEPRVATWIGMQRDRRNFVFKDPTITISPYIVSRALLMPEDEVSAAYTEIRRCLYED